MDPRNPYKSLTRPAAPAAPTPPKAPGRAFLGMKGKTVYRPAKEKDTRTLDPARYKAAFAVQRVTARLLHGEQKTTRTGKTVDRWPVVGCGRNMLGDVIGVYRVVDGSAARYAGAVTCGSVWTCPVCAGRVAEARRMELQLAIRRHAEKGGKVYLMTLTAPHTREMLLADFLALFKKALQRYKSCKTYKRISAQYGRIGSVRSKEITYGANGWHPHTHDLVFAADGLLDDARALEELRQEWTRICIKCGLGDNSKRNDMLAHAFDIQGGDYAAEYVAKFGQQPQLEQWGASDELTRSHSKTGARAGSMTPFALARAHAQGDTRDDFNPGALFVEYAHATEGERMLYWSPKLKAALDVVEYSDEDLARAPLPMEDRICELDVDQWRLVLSREARGELLFWAAKEGAAGVAAFLDELRERPRTHGNQFATRTARHE